MQEKELVLCSVLRLSPNKGRQWQNLLGCDNWVLARTPRPIMVGFCDLVGVAIAPVSKKLTVK